jgi:hypothetical protein
LQRLQNADLSSISSRAGRPRFAHYRRSGVNSI